MTTTTESATMTAQQAADRLGISLWAFYRHAKLGRLANVEDGGPIIRLGTAVFVNAERLEEWLRGGARPVPS